mmetsp:Transcript_10167/g.18332  ORF Transcript_10167/g.18332 Transcript_10167/m.18332 type:complete len:573 (-) Transcript_10167:189-1907(-)
MTTTGRSSPSSNMASPLPDLLAQRREEARRLKESAALRRTCASNNAAASSASPETAADSRTARETNPPSAELKHSASYSCDNLRGSSSVYHAAPSGGGPALSSRHGSFSARPGSTASPDTHPKLQTSASFDGRRNAALRGFAPSTSSSSPLDMDKLREQARALRGLPPTTSRPSTPTATTSPSLKSDERATVQRQLFGVHPQAATTTVPVTAPPSGVRGRVSAALSGIADKMAKRAHLRAAATSASSSPSPNKPTPSQLPPENKPKLEPSTVTQGPATTHSSRVSGSPHSPVARGSTNAGAASRPRSGLGVNVGDPMRASSVGKMEKMASGSSSPASPFTSPQYRPATQSPYSSSRMQAGDNPLPRPGTATSSPFTTFGARAPRPSPTKTTQAFSPSGLSRPQSPAMEQPMKVTRVGSFDSSKSAGRPTAFTRVNSANISSPRTPEPRAPSRSARNSSPPSTRASTPSPSSTPAKAIAPWEAGDSVHAIRSASKKLTKEQFMEYIYSRHQLKDPSKTLNSQLPVKKQMQKALSHYHPDKQNLAQDGPEWCLICEEICKEITRMYKKRETPSK